LHRFGSGGSWLREQRVDEIIDLGPYCHDRATFTLARIGVDLVDQDGVDAEASRFVDAFVLGQVVAGVALSPSGIVIV
jgi:hypothetical protein